MCVRSFLASVVLMTAASALAQPAPPIRERLVETAPGVRIHVLEAGEVNGKPPLVLVPGWRLTGSVWREQIAAFSRDRRVIALDPRSQGASTMTTQGDTPEDRARDIHAVIDALDADPVVLVGWSQGVQDVAAFVQQFGVVGLKGVVLVDSTISSGASGIAAAPTAAAAQLDHLSAYAHYPREATEAMMKAIIHKPLSAAELEELVTLGMKTPPAIGAAMLADDLFGPDRTPALAKMTLPVLVVASAESSELEAQKAMAARLPQARFEAVQGAGHAVFVDQPQRFNDILAAFIASLP